MQLFDFSGVSFGFAKQRAPLLGLSFAEDLLEESIPFGECNTREGAMALLTNWHETKGRVVGLTAKFPAGTGYKRAEQRATFILEETLHAHGVHSRWIGITRYGLAPVTQFFLEDGQKILDRLGRPDNQPLNSWVVTLGQTLAARHQGQRPHDSA